MSLKRSLSAAALAAAALVAAPASAIITFSSTTIINTPNFQYLNNGANPGVLRTTLNNGNSLASSLKVFSVTDAVAGFIALAATTSNFTLLASTPAVSGLSAGSPFSISGVNGTFSFIATAPITVGSVTGTNLLSATFQNATLAGTIGGSQISLGGNNDVGTLSFTSDFLDFSDVEDMAFALTGNTTSPLATATGGRLAGFRASVNGNFSSDPPPGIFGVIPEPETWAMLLLGFGLVGVNMRRRKVVVAA